MMERQEEKEDTEEKITRLCSTSNTLSLPLDLTSEVLKRLPAKSIVRSRCVSELWSSYTTLAYFNKLFTSRSSQTSSLLVFTFQGENLLSFVLPQHEKSDKSSSSSSSSSSCSAVDRFVIKYPKGCGFNFRNSVQGLYCHSRSTNVDVIWNPTMRRFSILTRPERCWKYTRSYIGYDPIDGTYKALCMPDYTSRKPKNKNSYLPQVLTLGRDKESWRFIEGSFEHYPLSYGLCINGVIYYEAFLTDGSDSRVVMSFHVRYEKFNMIQVPWQDPHGGYFSTYQGKLARITSCYDDFISLWILEDSKKHEWSFRKFSLPFPLDDPISQTHLFLSGGTDAGEFVYVPTTLLSTFHALILIHKETALEELFMKELRTTILGSVMDLETNVYFTYILFPIT